MFLCIPSVAIEMQNKLHKFQQSGSGDIIRHVIPTNTSHRRRVDESRVGLSFERQPSRCTVVVIQSFKARTQDEVQVKRGEHVKLLFIEGKRHLTAYCNTMRLDVCVFCVAWHALVDARLIWWLS